MQPNQLRPFFGLSVAIVAVVLFLGSCGKARQTSNFNPDKFDSLVLASRSVPHTVDSLLQAGAIGRTGADFYKVNYWSDYNDTLAMAIADTALNRKIENDEDRYFHYMIAGMSYQLDYIGGHYERGLRRTRQFLDSVDPDFIASHSKLRSNHLMLNSLLGYYNIYLYRFDEAEAQFKKTVGLIAKYEADAQGDSLDLALYAYMRIRLAASAMIAYSNMKQDQRAMKWLEVGETYLNDYVQKNGETSAAQSTSYKLLIMKALFLNRMGRADEAALAYQQAIKNPYYKSQIGRLNTVDYLLESHHYEEALKNIDNIEEILRFRKQEWNIDNIAGFVSLRFKAYLGAGRRDSALAIATRIIYALDSARVWAKRDKAAELATVYDTKDKEAQIAEKETSLLQTRITALIIALVLFIVFFIVYSVLRRRAAKLKVVQDRIEGELQIARNIQMSMVPHEFPHREGLDMYASMTPAKEVGGDLYGYVVRGNMLYFAVGDVSGKGVPASLFMAQATRLFRTMANQGLMPAEICKHMNAELGGDDNVNGMFVTMWIGMLNMDNGHLHFCNAGHNPPVIGGGENHGDFLQMESNAPIGLWPDLEYVGEEIDTIKNRPLFVYTDGLNEAEDPELQQFGDDRLLEILRNTHFDSAQQVVETLSARVAQHRRGAEANDDLTMLCLRVS